MLQSEGGVGRRMKSVVPVKESLSDMGARPCESIGLLPRLCFLIFFIFGVELIWHNGRTKGGSQSALDTDPGRAIGEYLGTLTVLISLLPVGSCSLGQIPLFRYKA